MLLQRSSDKPRNGVSRFSETSNGAAAFRATLPDRVSVRHRLRRKPAVRQCQKRPREIRRLQAVQTISTAGIFTPKYNPRHRDREIALKRLCTKVILTQPRHPRRTSFLIQKVWMKSEQVLFITVLCQCCQAEVAEDTAWRLTKPFHHSPA